MGKSSVCYIGCLGIWKKRADSELAEIPHLDFYCWVMENLGNDVKNSKIIVALNIFITCSCLRKPAPKNSVKLGQHKAFNFFLNLVKTDKNTESQCRRGVENNEFKKTQIMWELKKLLCKHTTGDEFVISNNGHQKFSAVFCWIS